MIRFVAALCAICLATTALANPPEETARRFVDLLVTSPVQGLPTKEQMKSFRPLLSKELDRLIAEARAEQDASAKKNPDEKPPWIEGALFSSLFEGITRGRLGQGCAENEYFTAPVYWEFTRGGETARWIDLVVLGKEGGAWKVRDVIYGAPWDFRPGPSLRSVLQERD
jgi:hypothetical protein